MTLAAAMQRRFNNDVKGATQALEDALKASPTDLKVWREIAANMVSAKDYTAAAEVLTCLHEAQPANPEPCYQLAALYDTLGQYDVALRWISAAFRRLTSSYGKVVCCTMYGELLYKVGQPVQGAHMWDLALSVPDAECNGPAMFAKAEILLARGEWAEGWRLFEARWHTEEAWRIQRLHQTQRETLAPEWDGRSPGRVAIYAEQGSGDVLMMLRYLDFVESHAAQVPVLVCQPEIVTFARNYLTCDVVANGERVEADYSLPIMSLPRVLGMPEPTARFSMMPREHTRTGALRVGVCWRGSRDHGNDRDRSSPIDFREAFNGIVRVEIISLQHGEPTKFKDFAATAAVIESCDVVVTVDTSVFHLAGTLGVPTIVIPPTRPELRFPLTSATTTPWYPSVSVVRRKRSDDWTPAIMQIRHRISELANDCDCGGCEQCDGWES